MDQVATRATLEFCAKCLHGKEYWQKGPGECWAACLLAFVDKLCCVVKFSEVLIALSSPLFLISVVP